MDRFGTNVIRDKALLVARILLVILFVTSGWAKLSNYSGTVAYMSQIGVPYPPIATIVAIVIETIGSIALILGIWTRPLAILLAVFTLATAFLGHHFWTMEGAERYANSINFYKNLGIIGGFLLLYVTGAGKYSVDARLGLAETRPRPPEFR